MGYAILSCVNFFLVILFKLLVNFPLMRLDILIYVLPVLTIFVFKRVLIWYLCRFVLTHRTGKTLRLKNMRLYLMVNHFNFFFDSFIIFFIAVMRVIYSILATLFFMPRLDYSIFGLFLERFDMGYMSYVSYMHMEVNQTHPVKMAFCELLKRYMNHQGYQGLRTSKKLVRNRWNLAYTLLKNPYLKRERKSFVHEQSMYRAGRYETLKQFIWRKLTKFHKKTTYSELVELKFDKSQTNDMLLLDFNTNEELVKKTGQETTAIEDSFITELNKPTV